MTSASTAATQSTAAWLVPLVARKLNLAPEALRTDVRLRRYGLDSLACCELLAHMSQRTGRSLPPTLLDDAPSIDDLLRFLAAPAAEIGDHGTQQAPPADLQACLQRDARLADDVQPSPPPASFRPPSQLLLTGATGFLGAFLLRALLRHGVTRAYCLVRAHDVASAWQCLQRRALQLGVDLAPFAERVVALPGDLDAPRLGLDRATWQTLVENIDTIVHGAARVNWATPYARLRETNVVGTEQLLRLACSGPAKALHFVSSLGTLCSTTASGPVDEASWGFCRVAGVHQGYFQSKCVAERLVQQASERGLAATIYRPTLLGGDLAQGATAGGDLVPALVRGCVAMGIAPDLDWALDICPVDTAAEAIATLATRGHAIGEVVHLANPAHRSWREVVLALNVFGHRVSLVPFASWLATLEREATTAAHPLFLLRPFFAAHCPDRPGLRMPELFERRNLVEIESRHSTALLQRVDIQVPPLSPDYLRRQVRFLEQQGLLPGTPQRDAAGHAGPVVTPQLLTAMLRRQLGDRAPQVAAVTPLPALSGTSIAGELTSWLAGATTGAVPCRLQFASGGLPDGNDTICLKVKAHASLALDAGEAVAWSCNPRLGAAFHQHRAATDLAGCHYRELGVFGQRDARFTSHTPRLYGYQWDDAAGQWILAMEWLQQGVLLLDSVDTVGRWQDAHIAAALQGAAALHALWWQRDSELRQLAWLHPVQSLERMVAMLPLLQAMADELAQFADAAGLPELRGLQQHALADLPQWRRELQELPQTLIHNDFNPRNLALRQQPAGWRLCAYDWELCSVGVPQLDVMELLCFVLDEHTDAVELGHWLREHARALVLAGAQPVSAGITRRAAQLALRQLLVNRWPVYAMVNRVRPQPFLGRVLRTWLRLAALLDADAT